MTIGGWIFMMLSVTFVASLASFCFYRVLTSPPRPSELDTQPADTASPAVQQRQQGKTAG